MMKTPILLIWIVLFLHSSIAVGQSKVEIINTAKESVVWIHAFNMPYSLDETSYGTGTGYVISGDGLVMTNHHVIANINGLICYSSSREEPYYGMVVWSDSILDLAVIKLHNCILKPLEFADPASVKQGDETLILGYPGMSYKTENLKVSWGLISSSPYDSTIQTTAAINPGNSGGPALNMQGKVIGTVYAKIAALSIEGTGFIRNVRYAKEALLIVQKLNIPPSDYFGTSDFEAYKCICDAAILGWKASQTEVVSTKVSLNNQAKDLILKALNYDPTYVEAFYFLANYYFIQSIYSCLDNNDAQSRSEFNNFKKALAEAELKAKSHKLSLYFEEGDLSDIAKEYEGENLNCSNVRGFYETQMAAALDQERRLDDFYNYIITGETPVLLRSAVAYGGGSKPPEPPKPESTFLKIGSFEKIAPVRFGVCLPLNVDPYTSNIGFSFGNVGYPSSRKNVSFKRQFSFTLLQDMQDEEELLDYQRTMVLSWNFGIQAKFFRMARFNPRPYITMGWNPASYQSKTISDEKYTEWYLTNGAFNFGLDFDIWLSGYFGLFVTYEYTTFFPNIFPTLYDEENSLKMKFSTMKLGIMF